jgi:DNA-binding beta-propeller fold protein YncE
VVAITLVAAPAEAVLAPTPPPLRTTWNRPVGGAGFFTPRSAAFAKDGSLWLVEHDLQQVQHLDASGHGLVVVGSFGGGDGQFYSPVGIAVGADGYVYVLDQFNSRISRFTADGTFVQRWGVQGNAPGQLANPAAIAALPSGELLVVDQSNDRIVRFTSTGTFVDEWGAPGGGSGQFDVPSSVAVDRRGDIYVTDTNNQRVEKFTATGRFLRQWGSAGSGQGQFTAPAGIAVDRFDRVFVSDVSANRVQMFGTDGTWTGTFGSTGTGPAQFRSPVALTASPNGDLFVVDGQNDRLQEFGGSGEAETQTLGKVAFAFATPGITPLSAAEGPDGDIFVAGGGAVERFAHDGTPRPPQNAWGATAFQNALAVRIAPDSSVCVLESSGFQVRRFTLDGTPINTFGGYGSEPGQMFWPWDIAIKANGDILVSNANYVDERVDCYSPMGALLSSFYTGGLYTPSTLALDPAGEIFTLDSRVLRRHAADGSLITAWTVYPLNSGQFGGGGLQCAGTEFVYVTDNNTRQLLKYEPSGQLLASINPAGAGRPDVTVLGRLGLDAQGNLLITANENGQVLRFAIAPRILSVADVTGDNGRAVHVEFRRTTADASVSDTPVRQYGIYRRLDPPYPPDANPAPDLPGWELAATVPATHADQYSVDVPMREDTRPGAMVFTAVLVRAITSTTLVLDSGISFGSSLDDLPPLPPSDFSGAFVADGVHLQWHRPAGDDAVAWELYRGATPDFEAEEDTRLGVLADSAYFDAGAGPGYYKLAALDPSGNRSSFLTLGPAGLLDVPGGTRAPAFSLGAVSPNPSRGQPLEVTFSLATRGSPSIELIDVTGRRVMAHAVGELSPGTHQVSLVPGRRLPAGLYLMRLHDGHGATRVARVVLLD